MNEQEAEVMGPPDRVVDVRDTTAAPSAPLRFGSSVHLLNLRYASRQPFNECPSFPFFASESRSRTKVGIEIVLLRNA